MTHQNLRLRKYWKLFWATLNDNRVLKKRIYFTYMYTTEFCIHKTTYNTFTLIPTSFIGWVIIFLVYFIVGERCCGRSGKFQVMCDLNLDWDVLGNFPRDWNFQMLRERVGGLKNVSQSHWKFMKLKQRISQSWSSFGYPFLIIEILTTILLFCFTPWFSFRLRRNTR